MAAHTNAQLGRRGERTARRFVRRLGWNILVRNWRHATLGEVDVVALDGMTVVFAEVKTRRADSASVPEDAMRPAKRDHLRSLARAFMRQYNLTRLPYRFDVLAVTVRPWPWPCRVVHYAGAFV
jgi:putative endonuclease